MLITGRLLNLKIRLVGEEANRILRVEHFEQVLHVKRCFQPFDVYAVFVRTLAVQQVEGQAPQSARVFGSVADAQASGIFAELQFVRTACPKARASTGRLLR
jgi:hypothetical protein